MIQKKQILLNSFILSLIIAAFLVSCKDEFSDIQALQLSSELKLKNDSLELLQRFKTLGIESQEQAESYLTALNEAGDLLQLTLLIRADNKPVGGVLVSLSGAAEPVTTNAEGMAIFDRVKIGESTLRVSKQGYTSASALITFGSPGAPVPITTQIGGFGGVTRYVPPVKRFENLSLPIFTLGNEGSTATISGVVTYEKDLTNDSPEYPKDLVITANLRNVLLDLSAGGSVPQSSNNGQPQILSYQLSEGDLGVAKVQADGSYQMQVPATLTGLNGITFNIPEIVDNQSAVIVARSNGTDEMTELANGPEKVDDILTKWAYTGSPLAPTPSGDIVVPSTIVEFPEPPLSGSGYNPAFTIMPRKFSSGFLFDDGNEETLAGITLSLTHRGSGYTSSPSVTFTPDDGTSAATSLRGYLSSLAVETGGVYGSNGDNVQLELFADYASGTTVSLTPVKIPMTLVAGGALPLGQVSLPQGIGFNPETPFYTNSFVTGFGIRVLALDGTEIIAAPTAKFNAAYVTELNALAIGNNASSGYTEAPTITLSGGGTTDQAIIQVKSFTKSWRSDFASNAAVIPYKVLPAGFDFQWDTRTAAGDLYEEDGRVLVQTTFGDFISNKRLDEILTTDGVNLKVAPEFSSLVFKVQQFSLTPPKLVIKPRPRRKAKGFVNIENGKVTSVNVIEDGMGYDESTIKQISLKPSFPGAPGQGATLSVNPVLDLHTKEVTSFEIIVVSQGLNYRSNVNIPSKPVTADPIPVVKTGQKYRVDIHLGTGVRLVEVQGYE